MAGHVYLIGSSAYSWYKIGKSADARIRVTELGVLLPFRIEVFAVWKAENHHDLEKLLHEKYAKNRINGEWFKFSFAQVKSLLALMADAQIPVASGFSNIQETMKEYRLRLGLDTEFTPPDDKHPARARIAELIKVNHQLRMELQKFIGTGNLPVQ